MTNTIQRTALGAAVAVLLVGAGVAVVATRDDTSTPSRGANVPRQAAAANAAASRQAPAPTRLAAPPTVKVGLVTSSSGTGTAAGSRAGGAQVAAFRLNADKADGPVSLLAEDDRSDPVAAVDAVHRLIDQGVAGIVYASVGDHMLDAVRVANDAGVPVLVPYSGDERLTAVGPNVYLTGPSDTQAAQEIAGAAKARGWSRVAVLHDQGAGGQAGRSDLLAAGLVPASTTSFDPAAVDIAPAVKAAIGTDPAAVPDAIVIWGELTAAQKALVAVDRANPTAQIVLSSSSATPAFGAVQTSLADSPATDGILSVGSWAGPQIPAARIDAFYRARAATATAGAASGVDLGTADLGAHDAVVAIAEAARSAGSGERAAVRKALAGSKPSVTGAALDFSRQSAFVTAGTALLTYSSSDDGGGRWPAAATKGGHWVAVPGTFTLPSELAGLDDAWGG